MYNINFIAYAIDLKGKSIYEDFLIPYTFFSLLFNKNSHVEIIVLNPENFKKKYNKEIKLIGKILNRKIKKKYKFYKTKYEMNKNPEDYKNYKKYSIKLKNKNFLIRKPQYKLNKHIPNTYRFFEVPTVKSKFTYISDIDIMYLENILPSYLKNWPINLPYNNKIRKNIRKLTGLMMVKNNKYYTNKFKICQKKYYETNYRENDEKILYKMCKNVHGLPNQKFSYRPVYGIHFSPNRGKNKRMILENAYNNIFINAKKYIIFL